MINALFIFNQKGDILISSILKDGAKRNISDIFRIQVISNHDIRSPILTLGSTTFLYIKHSDLWIVAVTRSNTDAGVIFEFLFGFQNLLTSYFGGSLNEDLVKDHFTTIYSLIDEVLDYGYPQTVDFNSLKELIKPPVDIKGNKPSLVKARKNSSISNSHYDLTSEMPWRKPGIKYRKNEIFLDVYEKLNVLISQDGKIIRSFVDGTIKMKTHLTGMPICKFGLNDSLSMNNESNGDALAQYDIKNKKAIPKAAAGNVILEDCKFHQCVQLDKFDSDRLIEFVPPDGEFELMKYLTHDNLNLPFKLTPMFQELSSSSSELRLNLKSLFPAKLNATDVVVKIPTQKNTIDVQFASSGGKAKFSTKDGAIYWKFNKFAGSTEHSLTATIQLSKSMADTPQSFGLSTMARPPISINFELLMFSSSGLVIRFLKVQEKANYNTVKWVRYISQGGAYEVRY